MNGKNHTTAMALALIGLLGIGSAVAAAEQESAEGLIEMIVMLVQEEDRDMRALGFQQVREEVPGEAATARFATLLADLVPDAQAGLLEALGDRGDAAARPAVLTMLESKEESVRAAAIRALGNLGTAADIPLLASKTAASAAEREAARQSLVRIRGEGIDESLATALDGGSPKVQVELLAALASRNAKGMVSRVMQCAKAEQASVRLAAIGALRFLADVNDCAPLAALVKSASDDQERRASELALLSLCSRGRQACADPLIAALADAPADAQIVIVRALARAGGDKALQAILGQLGNDNEQVHAEAVRMLSRWPDRSAVPHLERLAETKTAGNHRDAVLALRGLVRLASPQEDQPADVKLLAKAMKLADRPEEKRLVLGTLGSVNTGDALALASTALSDSSVTEEAALAVVLISEKIEGGDKSTLRPSLQKVIESSKDAKLRQRAEKVLKSL